MRRLALFLLLTLPALTSAQQNGKSVHVDAYQRKDGTWVKAHDRHPPGHHDAPTTAPAAGAPRESDERPKTSETVASRPEPTRAAEPADNRAAEVFGMTLLGLVVAGAILLYRTKLAGGSERPARRSRASSGDNPFA